MAATAKLTRSNHESLNDAQRWAVTSTAKTVAILAGPGSGKTHTLAARIVWLIDHGQLEPQDIIVTTFTVKAAREMKERIGKALGNGTETKIVLGTFHSIARRYLAAYGTKIGLDKNFSIADENDSRAMVRRIISRFQLGLDPAAARDWISKKKSRGMSNDLPGRRRREEGPEFTKCFEEYQEQLARSNLLDYDDLLVRCVELLREFPGCVSNVQAVLIDEYQDTNRIQYELMKLFAQKRRRITIVGDPDQSIYGWRSADIGNLNRLLQEYPGTDEVSLEQNYRSSQKILDAAMRVIQQDKDRYEKSLVPTHNQGTRPVLRSLKSSHVEADWMIQEIRRISTLLGSLITHDDVAILLRSASLSIQIEASLRKAGIPYRMVGGFKFYERAEIKILLDYLRVVYQPDNNDALVRVINVPKRGVGDATVKGLLEEAETTKRSLWKLLLQHCRGDRFAKTKITKSAEQKLSGGLHKTIQHLREKVERAPPGEHCDVELLVNQLIERLDFKKHLEDTYGPDYESRWANVQAFVDLARDFMRDLAIKESESLPTVEGLEQETEVAALGLFLSDVALASDAMAGDDKQAQQRMVTISTIHAAKGLEWPVVFVPSVYEGMIPHARSDDTAEDRRLLYVAMTRAKALLYLSCPLSTTRGDSVQLSQFLPSQIATSFAKKGPSIEHRTVQDIAKILGREPPAQKAIFDQMPAMFNPEDDIDVYPIDPKTQPKIENQGAAQRGDVEDEHRRKRPRVANSHAPAVSESAWNRGYKTTMECASGFTMPATAEFVKVGAHRDAINKAAAEEAADAASVAALGWFAKLKQPPKRGPPRPPAQQSLQDFLSGQPKPEAAPYRPQPAISCNPELLARKLTPGAILGRPAHERAKGVAGPLDEAARRRYSHFSSSPPKPLSPDQNQTQAGEPPLKIQTARPAATFHATSMGVLKSKAAGMGRVQGLQVGGRSAMEQLRKPFKPLTMNRPGGSNH